MSAPGYQYAPQAYGDVLAVGRPRSRPYLVLLGFSGMALCGLVVLGLFALLEGPGDFVVGLFFALLPVPLLVAGVLALDRFEPEPKINLALTFVWGASVAALLALVLNDLDQALLTSALGKQNGSFFTAVIGAPIVEETVKGAIILCLLKFGRGELDGPLDGIVYAGCVGLGFAMTENVLYYSRALGESGGATLIFTFVLRGLLSPFAHPLFTSATGIGLGVAAINRRRGVRIGAPLLGLFVAMLLHGTWNAAASHGVGALALTYLFVHLPVFIAVVVIAFAERRRISRAILRQLEPYARTGWLGPFDVAMVASLPQRARARALAARFGGPPAKTAMRHYQLAATELALLHDRADRGITDRWFDARRRALMTQLLGWRRALPYGM